MTEAVEQQKQFGIQRIYVKDVSFESPQGVAIFNKTLTPAIEQELATAITAVGDDHCEVVLIVTITARQDEQVLFLVEVHQAGLFAFKGFDEVQLRQMTSIHCPSILFPYARQAIDGLLQQASLPPLLLPPVNFESLILQVPQPPATAH